MCGIKLEVWGDYALFTKPEFKAERFSYDVMTPSAARAILEAIYWKPAIKWNVNKIHVINEVKFSSVKRNEVGNPISYSKVISAMKNNDTKGFFKDVNTDRQQRFSMILKDVRYVIEAEFEMTEKAGSDETEAKHISVARRRMSAGQTFNQPYFGCREFSANFCLLENAVPESFYKGKVVDLGMMLYDINYKNSRTPEFFQASMIDGVINTRRKEVSV